MRFLASAITIGLTLLMAGNFNRGQADEKRLPLEPPAGPVEVPEPSAKALEYYESGNVLWWISLEWQLLILCLFLFTGLSAWIRRQAERIGRNWFFTFVIYFLIFSILNYLLYFPLGYFQGFIRPHSYGLSDLAFSKWLRDSLKGLLVSLVLSVLFLWITYLLMKQSPKRWCLHTVIFP